MESATPVQDDQLEQKPKQVRRPKFHHNPELAKTYPLERLLAQPQAIPALVLVDRHGLLTNEMLQDLLYRDHRNPETDRALKDPEKAMQRTANRLIIRLKDAELIERRMVWMESAQGFPYPYPCNQLTSKGANLLKRYYREHGGTLRWRSSLKGLTERGARHSLEINRFYVALQRSCWFEDVDLSYWRDDRQLAAMDRGSTHFDNVPDAFFLLERDGVVSAFFLEIDRGYETIASLLGDEGDWTTKIDRYSRFLAYEFERAPYFDGLPFPTVLTVTTSRNRMSSMLTATDSSSCANRFLYATFDELYPDKHPVLLQRSIWHGLDGETRRLIESVSWSPVLRRSSPECLPIDQ